jgi:hypothetical protein
MDIFKDFTTFVWLICQLSQLDCTELGYDPAFQFMGKALCTNDQFNMRIIDPTHGVFDIVAKELLWSTKSLFGQVTQCWKVKIINKPGFTDSYILKQSFIDVAWRLTKDNVYTGIEKHVKAGVAHHIACQRVEPSDGTWLRVQIQQEVKAIVYF